MATDMGMTWQFILGKQLLNAASSITPTHGKVLQLTRKVEGVGHILSMDN
jgi:hypothetical protein